MSVLLFLKLFLYAIFHYNIGVASQIADMRLPILKNNNIYYFPYESNVNLDKNNAPDETAIIVVHGILKNSLQFYQIFKTIAIQHNVINQTVIISPQFLAKGDIENHHLSKNVLFWQFEGWNQGGLSENNSSSSYNQKIGSFDIMDQFLNKLKDKEKFPHLKRVYIIGFSAGAQFVQRYAALTNLDQELNRNGIKTTFLIISPSNLLYFTRIRPNIDFNNTFSMPMEKELRTCPNYDQYKYGIEDIKNYFPKVISNEVLGNYSNKNIIYMVGSEDKERDLFLDKSCQADMQGKQRIQRLNFYMLYLKNEYGDIIYNHQFLVIVPGAAHDYKKIFSSAIFQNLIFD